MAQAIEEIISDLAKLKVGGDTNIQEIYDRIAALEKKAPHLTRSETKELEQEMGRMFSWANKVSQKTGIALPKL